MRQGNPLMKGCLYFFGGLFLLTLLIELTVPLAICAGLGFGGYYLYRRWRYPLLKDQSLADQIELLKARIGQADKDIKQLDDKLAEEGAASYRKLSKQVLIELETIHQEATRLKKYLEDGVYQRIDKKVRKVRADIRVQLERLEAPERDVPEEQASHLSTEQLAPELKQTLENIAIDHQAILDKIQQSDNGNKEELLTEHQVKMERFEKILESYLKIKAEPKNYKNAEERLAQSKDSIEQFDIELDYFLQKLNEDEMRDLDINIRMMSQKHTDTDQI